MMARVQKTQKEKLTCKIHSQNVNLFELETKQQKSGFTLIPHCSSCANREVSRDQMIFISIEQIHKLINLAQLIIIAFSKPIEYVQTLKEMISKELKQKFIRKVKYESFYSQLSDSNRYFLQNKEKISPNQEIAQSQSLRLNQFQTSLNDSGQFKYRGNFNLNRNIKADLNLENELNLSFQILKSFFVQIGLKFKKQLLMQKILVLNADSTQLIQLIEKILQLKQIQLIKSKILVVESILFMARVSSLESIDCYMKKFINLYESFRLGYSGRKFKVSQSQLINFCFNIERTTVTRKNATFYQEIHYQPASYEQQFIYVNDGSFVFQNQSRVNFLYEEQKSKERESGALIKKDYLNTLQRKDQIEGKLVLITKFLSFTEKLHLKLRLNAGEFDQIGIHILWSSSIANFLKSQQDQQIALNLCIVPDEGENRKLYRFSQHYPHVFESLIAKSAIQNQRKQKIYFVLEDDEISLCLGSLDMEQPKVICWNQTRKYLIWAKGISKTFYKISDSIELQAALSVGVVLYSSFSEVEIY